MICSNMKEMLKNLPRDMNCDKVNFQNLHYSASWALASKKSPVFPQDYADYPKVILLVTLHLLIGLTDERSCGQTDVLVEIVI